MEGDSENFAFLGRVEEQPEEYFESVDYSTVNQEEVKMLDAFVEEVKHAEEEEVVVESTEEATNKIEGEEERPSNKDDA